MNNICNMYWSLDFNTNSEVWEGPSVRQTHFRYLSLDEHEKLQVFLNYSLHRDHDSTDSDILPLTMLFKTTVNLFTSLKFFFIMQITSAKFIKKSAFDTLMKLNTSVKKTATSKNLIFTDSSLPSSLSIVLLKTDLVKEEDELVQLSDEDEAPEFSELKDLQNQVTLLRLKKLELAQYADEKVSFLTLLTVRLNETLLLQGEDVISADTFIKWLLDELMIQTDWALVEKIINWHNNFKTSICGHCTSCNQIRSAANHFSLMKAHIFTHTENHQAKISQWAETEDLNWVNEPDDDWSKYSALSKKVTDTAVLSVKEEPAFQKCIWHT